MRNGFIGKILKLVHHTISDGKNNSANSEASVLIAKIGKGSYGSPEVFCWNDGSELSIGAYCSIAEGVKVLLGGNHRIDWLSTYPFNKKVDSLNSITGHPATKGDVKIGNDVWIGRDVLILSGVEIGTGAVIGARSVVTKAVAPYAVVAGNPARFIRRRFDDSTCEKLLESRWWELDENEVIAIAPILMSADVDLLIEKIQSIRSSLHEKKRLQNENN